MLGMTPFCPKTGGKPYQEKFSYLGIVYAECFHTGNMTDNMKGNYDAKSREHIFDILPQLLVIL